MLGPSSQATVQGSGAIVRVTEHNPSDPANQAARPPGIVKLVAKSPAEISQGAGLGAVLSPEEAQARLDAYATPAKGND